MATFQLRAETVASTWPSAVCSLKKSSAFAASKAGPSRAGPGRSVRRRGYSQAGGSFLVVLQGPAHVQRRTVKRLSEGRTMTYSFGALSLISFGTGILVSST